MNLDERLDKMAKKKPSGDPYYQDEPDGMAYMPWEKRPFLNEEKGVFASKEEKSLNKAPSVFDATAIFKVGHKQEDYRR